MLHDAQGRATDPASRNSRGDDFRFGVCRYARRASHHRRRLCRHAGIREETSGGAARLKIFDQGCDGRASVSDVIVVVRGGCGGKRRTEGTDGIVGIHAHVAAHRHSHSHRVGACQGGHTHADDGHSHRVEACQGGTRTRTTARFLRTRHVVVSQVRLLFTNLRKEQYKAVEFRGADTGAGNRVTLVIIGLSLGVSQSPLTIRR
ncbi:hypothetical protein HPP92_000601 [Vanilla planifolia]|uniref:Uncharacterized protein n=1 Tax=Vanilla planifolia TaxID=51239 RepID=A0A835VG90_VANPL|nr:hypothetical protein HPP92_000601 [Vanilla planifolia]